MFNRFFLEMVKTLEQERRIKMRKKIAIMKMRFPNHIMEELIAKWIGGFDINWVLESKEKINETRWMTYDSSDRGT